MKRKELIRAAKFTLFSASAGLIELGAFALLNETMHLPYWLSYITALTLSVVWNFTLNRSFTFQSAVNIPPAMLNVKGCLLLRGIHSSDGVFRAFLYHDTGLERVRRNGPQHAAELSDRVSVSAFFRVWQEHRYETLL